jgi:hypothetical protein
MLIKFFPGTLLLEFSPIVTEVSFFFVFLLGWELGNSGFIWKPLVIGLFP